MSGLGLVILQPGQFLDQNPLNPLNPVNIFVFDGTITKPIWPMSSINFYKMNLLSTSHSPQVNLVDYRNLNLWRDFSQKRKKVSNPIDFFFSQMRPAKVSNVTKLSSRHAVHIFRNSSWTILVSIPLSFSGKGFRFRWIWKIIIWVKKSLKGIILVKAKLF